MFAVEYDYVLIRRQYSVRYGIRLRAYSLSSLRLSPPVNAALFTAALLPANLPLRDCDTACNPFDCLCCAEAQSTVTHNVASLNHDNDQRTLVRLSPLLTGVVATLTTVQPLSESIPGSPSDFFW